MLPESLHNYLEAEHHLHIQRAVPIDGGCINNAFVLVALEGKFCLKWNANVLPGMFSVEARGLAQIAASQTIRVPRVFGYCDQPGDGIPGYIWMEWIEHPQSKFLDMRILGEQLAQLHLFSSQPGQLFGLDYDNFIGSTPQVNQWCDQWPEFFRDQRLGFQAKLAERNGHLSLSMHKRLDRLLDNIGRFLPERAGLRPSLLHGDLWSGNVIPDLAGRPVLIDPAVYYGDREAEIAYTELFGGFSPDFYQAYKSVHPLDPGYPDRRDLYNLYHLLNHLNLFGKVYGAEIDNILNHFTS